MTEELGSVENEATTDDCYWCGQPGGDMQIDPYREEICGVQVLVRLHLDCARELCQEI